MILIRGKEGVIHRSGKEIQNVFQNLFKQRGKWRRQAARLDGYYTEDAQRARNERKLIICMYDGRMDHGGIADRLRGAVSAYYVCREMGYDFRIFFNHPFRLDDYLVPNTYDWRISQDELCYHPADAEAMFCGSNGTYVEPFFQKLWLRKRFREARKQLHVYTNALLLPRSKRYGELARELFRPSEKLEQALARYSQPLQGGYYTMSLRFIGLLDDFTERDGKHIAPQEQQLLMDRCIAQIQKIYQRLNTRKRVLLTSDSQRFLKYAAERLDFVYYIPGDIVHIDYQDATSDDVNIKLFVDMMLISRAERAFLLQTGGMYNSGFPRRAAQMGSVPFKHIRF